MLLVPSKHKKQCKFGAECKNHKCNFVHPGDEEFAGARVAPWKDIFGGASAAQMESEYNSLFADPQVRKGLSDFSMYDEGRQDQKARCDAWFHLKFALEDHGCWVENPKTGSYDMDYCLGVAHEKDLLAPELQQMTQKLNQDRNRANHAPSGSQSRLEPPPTRAARAFSKCTGAGCPGHKNSSGS